MQQLNGRLPFIENLNEEQKSLAKRLDGGFVKMAESAGFKPKDEQGRFIGPFNAMLYNARIGEGLLGLQEAEAKSTSLSKRLREVVILSVGSVWGAHYELYAHSAVGAQVGLTPGQIHALREGRGGEGLTKEDLAAQEFTLQIVAKRSVDNEAYGRAREIFGDRGLVEMLALIGNYQSVCGFLNAFQVPAAGESK